ncbi:hypothetical protein [Pseudoclavibacter sp. AY1F1]|uniref:hypothetical protein n=1 Tax=Pseudoclavibacter sp. AY1F1 TaxID=2080583 RepID=UPI001CA5B3C9|nr:hypothetical protein [Pseudoclavibacter sp. AY1F1]
MPKSLNSETAVQKHFSTSILLWVRNDQPRQAGMDYWKGPHSVRPAQTWGLRIHLTEQGCASAKSAGASQGGRGAAWWRRPSPVVRAASC